MPACTVDPRSTVRAALAVALVLTVLGFQWLGAPSAVADPTEQTTQLCRDAPRGCQILWDGGAPQFLDSTTAYRARVLGRPGVTVSVAMYEILFDDAGEVIGIKQFRTTDPMTTEAGTGVAPQPMRFSDIDRADPPGSGYGLVSVADLPADTTNFSEIFGEVYPMAHVRPYVLGDGWEATGKPAGHQASLDFLGGSPRTNYELEFRAPGSDWKVVSSTPVPAQAPPDWVTTISYTVPDDIGSGSFRLVPSDDYFAPIEWAVEITENGLAAPNRTSPTAPQVGAPVWAEPQPTDTTAPSKGPDPTEPPNTEEPDPSESPDPSAQPSGSADPDPTSTAEPSPSMPEPTTSRANSRPTPGHTHSAPQPPVRGSATGQPEPPTASTAPSASPPAEATPTPSPFGSATPQPGKRVRSEEKAERITDPTEQAATAPRWSGGLVGGLATATIVGAATWVWRSRRETASTLAGWGDE